MSFSQILKGKKSGLTQAIQAEVEVGGIELNLCSYRPPKPLSFYFFLTQAIIIIV